MNTIPMTCPHCGQVTPLQRALAVWCPDCPARAGEPCVDLRLKTRKPVRYFHSGRKAAVRTTDPVVRAAG